MPLERVPGAEVLVPGAMRQFSVSGTEVLLVRLSSGDFVATQASCPHQDVSLADGALEDDELTCRAHLWQFDLLTCASVWPRGIELARYPVYVQGDAIYIDLGSP